MTPERHGWAVDQLKLTGTEKVLEFGSGPGVATRLACDQLTSGTVLAIDKSPVAVRRTSDRNREHLTSGRLTVRRCALGELEVPADSLDVAFGINVNVFWTTKATPEFKILSRALVQGGRLLIAYGAGPRHDENDDILDSVLTAAKAAEFDRATVLKGLYGTAAVLAHRA